MERAGMGGALMMTHEPSQGALRSGEKLQPAPYNSATYLELRRQAFNDFATRGMQADRGLDDAVVASAADARGPYGPRYTALTHGGHGNFFQDHTGQWWACVFNQPSQAGSPYCSLPECWPALAPMCWEGDRILPAATGV